MFFLQCSRASTIEEFWFWNMAVICSIQDRQVETGTPTWRSQLTVGGDSGWLRECAVIFILIVDFVKFEIVIYRWAVQ